MAKKRQKKEEAVKSKFAKFLPGESTWKGRINKTRQDRMPMERRDRVAEAQERTRRMKTG